MLCFTDQEWHDAAALHRLGFPSGVIAHHFGVSAVALESEMLEADDLGKWL